MPGSLLKARFARVATTCIYNDTAVEGVVTHHNLNTTAAAHHKIRAGWQTSAAGYGDQA